MTPILNRTIFLCDERELSPARTTSTSICCAGRGPCSLWTRRSVIALHRAGNSRSAAAPGILASRWTTLIREAARPLDVMFLGAHSLRRTQAS